MLKKFVEKFINFMKNASPLGALAILLSPHFGCVFHHVRSQTRHRTFSIIDGYTAYYRRAFM